MRQNIKAETGLWGKLKMNILFFAYFILIAVLACKSKNLFALFVCVIAPCHLTILYSKSMFPVSPFLSFVLVFFVLFSCLCLINKYNKLLQGELDEIQRDSQKMQEKLNVLKEKDAFLLSRNAQLEKSLNEIVTIYEYVKKLSSTMDFGEAVRTLEGTLRLLVQFSAGKLFVIENKDVSKIYCIQHEESGRALEISGLGEYEKNIISKMVKNPQIIVYEKGKMTSLGRFPSEVETLIALPLLVEKQLVAVIVLENIQLSSTDKIHFITLQFAMEVKKAQLYGKVNELSKIDSLTHLYLRRHFMELLANELDRGCRQNQSMTFLMLDVDYFKKYNDEYGHLVGDLILKKVGGILKEKSREIDLLCRYGGDEFALALPRTNLQEAYTVAERLRRAVGEHLFHVAKEQFQITISVGITICEPEKMDQDKIADMIIDLADKALYEAKALGRNRVVVVGLS
jgi:diguanylate cyclase (GGDEF)-like protein